MWGLASISDPKRYSFRPGSVPRNLFVNLREGAAAPVGGNLQAEEVGDDGRRVVLHHRGRNFVALLDTGTVNEERCLQLLHRQVSMSLARTAMVGGDGDKPVLLVESGAAGDCRDLYTF